MREEFNIQVKRSRRSDLGAKKGNGNNDGEGSSDSEEYYAEMQKIKEGQKNAAKKKFVPSLKIGGLGLSSLVKGDASKTQEELDVEDQVLQNKHGLLSKQGTEPTAAPSMPQSNVQHNRFVSETTSEAYKLPPQMGSLKAVGRSTTVDSGPLQEQLFLRNKDFERTTPTQAKGQKGGHPMQNQELENVLNSISDLNVRRGESMGSSPSGTKQSNNPRTSIQILREGEVDEGKRAKILD